MHNACVRVLGHEGRKGGRNVKVQLQIARRSQGLPRRIEYWDVLEAATLLSRRILCLRALLNRGFMQICNLELSGGDEASKVGPGRGQDGFNYCWPRFGAGLEFLHFYRGPKLKICTKSPRAL
jgi:hypothetical protein